MNIHARQYELSDGANAAAPQTLLLNKSESESENNYKHDEKNANRAECWLAGVTFWAWLCQKNKVGAEVPMGLETVEIGA